MTSHLFGLMAVTRPVMGVLLDLRGGLTSSRAFFSEETSRLFQKCFQVAVQAAERFGKVIIQVVSPVSLRHVEESTGVQPRCRKTRPQTR